MKMNGIITEHRIDFKLFHLYLGGAFEFHISENKYVVGILNKIDEDNNKLHFVTLDEPIIVSLSGDDFSVKYGNSHSYNGFKRLGPTYKKEDDFGFGA